MGLIGTHDRLDQLLAKKYSKEKVNNLDDVTRLAVPADRIMEIMNDYGKLQKAVLALRGIIVNNKPAIKRQLATQPA